MRITEIKVLPVDGDEKLKAYVTIKLDDCFVIRDMKIIKGTTGYFVAMPAKKMKDGTYRDLVHPLDKPTRQDLEDQVLVEFRKLQAELKADPAQRAAV
jgi:stage V sporulation protein G